MLVTDAKTRNELQGIITSKAHEIRAIFDEPKITVEIAALAREEVAKESGVTVKTIKELFKSLPAKNAKNEVAQPNFLDVPDLYSQDIEQMQKTIAALSKKIGDMKYKQKLSKTSGDYTKYCSIYKDKQSGNYRIRILGGNLPASIKGSKENNFGPRVYVASKSDAQKIARWADKIIDILLNVSD